MGFKLTCTFSFVNWTRLANIHMLQVVHVFHIRAHCVGDRCWRKPEQAMEVKYTEVFTVALESSPLHISCFMKTQYIYHVKSMSEFVGSEMRLMFQVLGLRRNNIKKCMYCTWVQDQKDWIKYHRVKETKDWMK